MIREIITSLLSDLRSRIVNRLPVAIVSRDRIVELLAQEELLARKSQKPERGLGAAVAPVQAPVLAPPPVAASPNLSHLQASVSRLQEEVKRVCEPLLQNLKSPGLSAALDNGEAAELEIRRALLVPGWQPFNIGRNRLPLPISSAIDSRAWRAYVNTRCPDMTPEICSRLLSRLDELHRNRNIVFEDIAELLSLAPAPDVLHYQTDWYREHCPNIAQEEAGRMMNALEEALADSESAVAAIFIAFNFRMFVVSAISARINGSRYYEKSSPSPFVYMMA